jgi:hypothetical protein
MSLIGFTCPLCDGRLSKEIDYIPDDAVIEASCPHCMHEFELTLDETTIQIINLDEVRRLWQ